MSEAFLQLCAEVDGSARLLHSIEECQPHYQRVLDYIMEHPEERSFIARALTSVLTGETGAARASIYLLQFLMQSLQWPEVRLAAEHFSFDGNAWYDHEIQKLIRVYENVQQTRCSEPGDGAPVDNRGSMAPGH